MFQDDGKGGASKSVRDLLKQMVENKSKELTVKNVVENLLVQNEVLLAQSDAQALKPNPRTVKPKVTDQSFESHGSILTPKDPTESCSKEDMPNINNALVEVCVSEANTTNYDPDLVCAVGSKIILLTPQGQPLQMDVTYYWCNFCSYKSEKKATLLQHVMEHRFHCKYCKFQSFSRAAVIHHCTKDHESFSETASTLKYCTYLPDLLKKNEMKKRKNDTADDTPSSKRTRVYDIETLNMEVEEVENTEFSTGISKSSIPSDVVTENNKVSSNSSPATEVSLPVISNVISGLSAVNAAITKAQVSEAPVSLLPTEAASTSTPGIPSNITVSSGLCWNCGYCDFVTLSQSFLKIHLNARHPGKAHKYVAMLVSSQEELIRIKAADAQMVTHPVSCAVVAVPPVKQTDLTSPPTQSSSSSSTSISNELPAPRSSASLHKMPGIEIDNAENQVHKAEETENQVDKAEETEEEKKIPVSYKCAHCNFSYSQEEKVKVHLFQRHNGCVMYALDMKAVKLKKKRYIFFCLKGKCAFKTKETDEYLEHINTCTPWLDGTERKDVDAGMVKSLELTKSFIEKTAVVMSFGKDTKADKSAEYACIHCSYISNNNTRLKKHVLTNHVDKRCVIKDVPASKANKKNLVYFCNFCLWETREDSELEKHVAERHNTALPITKPATPAAPLPNNFQTKAKEETENMKQEKEKKSPVQKKKHLQETPSPEAKEYKSDDDDNDDDDDDDVEDDSEVGENKYDGIMPSDLYEKAMTEYLSNESQDVKKGRGRPSRKSAIKCRMKVKSMKTPPLYKCVTCSEVHFGTKLMKRHLQEKHKTEPLRAIDVLKESKKNPNYYIFFCPSDNCVASESFAIDMINHAKNKHGISGINAELVKIMAISGTQSTSLTTSRRGRPATAATGESYECLYCTTSLIYHSRKDMKIHLLNKHNGEEFIYRDCIARKLRQTSRYYMCHNLNCDFTTEKQKDYLLHMLGHQKAKIFECSKCQWFTSVSGEIKNHLLNVHKGEDLTTLEVDLDLDSTGRTVKSINGTVIKSER